MPRILCLIAGPAFAALVLAFVLLPTAARAQLAQVDRIEIFDAGIYCADTVRKVADPNAPSGFRNVVTNVKFLRAAYQIPAKLGTRFGMQYKIIGSRPGELADLRLVTRISPPGLVDPVSGKTFLSNEYAILGLIGSDGYWEYHIEYDWEVVPGVWAFEIWHQDRKLAEQRFALINPQRLQKDLVGCAPVVSSIRPTGTSSSN